ncbi:unnamed protein product [Brachionus calyciflorus]|uniref:Sjoegren syndrome/scleroderma autoantigen 1 n=1 Tax=Brachionus calyciflorus TaxID=104777 RepID=A0A813Q0G6_9BILA|nr:unnamed protein product [Brachionus calyciflorus]
MDEFIDDDRDFKFYQNAENKNKEKKRSDLVSKKLGELLLQGYRMLNSTCDKCDCILMQKKNEPVYCVGCQDPDLIALDLEQTQQSILKENPVITKVVTEESPMDQTFTKEDKYNNNKSSNQFSQTIDTIRSKISWATEQLKTSTVLSYDIELLEYIKKCSETISAIKNTNL